MNRFLISIILVSAMPVVADIVESELQCLYFQDLFDSGQSEVAVPLAQCYVNGWGVKKDVSKGEQILIEAVEKGDLRSKRLLIIHQYIYNEEALHLNPAFQSRMFSNHRDVSLIYSSYFANRGNLELAINYLNKSISQNNELALAIKYQLCSNEGMDDINKDFILCEEQKLLYEAFSNYPFKGKISDSIIGLISGVR